MLNAFSIEVSCLYPQIFTYIVYNRLVNGPSIGYRIYTEVYMINKIG